MWDPDNYYYNSLTMKLRTEDNSTNLWEARGNHDDELGRAVFSRDQNEDVTSDDSIRAACRTDKRSRSDYQPGGHFGRTSDDSKDEPGWMKSVFEGGLSAINDGHDTQTSSFADKIKAMNDQTSQASMYSRTQPLRVEEDMLGQPKSPYAGTEYTSAWSATKGKTVDETYYSPLPIQTTIQRPAYVPQNPDVYARQEPPPSPAGDVQSRPAILPFPKKPGSVFP